MVQQQIVGNKLHEWADSLTKCLIVTFLALVNIILISADLDEYYHMGATKSFIEKKINMTILRHAY